MTVKPVRRATRRQEQSELGREWHGGDQKVLSTCTPVAQWFSFYWEGFRFKVNQPKKDDLFFPWPLGI